MDKTLMARLREQQFKVVTREQALSCGIPRSTVLRMIGPDGRWQRLLPGVYLTVTGTPTLDQLDMAALLYGGSQGTITGTAALRRHGITLSRSSDPYVVDVLIPWNSKRRSTGYVRLQRTRRAPYQPFSSKAIRYAGPERAVADAARLLATFNDVRDVVSQAIQRGKCTVIDLITELKAGPQARTAYFRESLTEVADNVHSVAEGDLRTLILGSDLPEPIYNARLYDANGWFIAKVDAWWQRAGVAAEVDSRAYHFKAADQDATNTRHNRLTAKYGIHLVHYAPKAVRTRGKALIAELKEAIATGVARPPLPISVRQPGSPAAQRPAAQRPAAQRHRTEKPPSTYTV